MSIQMHAVQTKNVTHDSFAQLLKVQYLVNIGCIDPIAEMQQY